jgi:hypothetical protein
MTLQTAAPIERLGLEDSYRSSRELVRMIHDGLMTVDTPYQRGSVWTLRQRIELIRSLLSGTPVPSIIANDRATPAWPHTPDGPAGGYYYAVIDGKQRLETMIAWYASELAVPASWFPPEDATETEDTEDGPYVRFAGLTPEARRAFPTKALLPFAVAKVGSIEAEAEIYGRVNGGGTPQTAEDMARAAAIASADAEHLTELSPDSRGNAGPRTVDFSDVAGALHAHCDLGLNGDRINDLAAHLGHVHLVRFTGDVPREHPERLVAAHRGKHPDCLYQPHPIPVPASGKAPS